MLIPFKAMQRHPNVQHQAKPWKINHDSNDAGILQNMSKPGEVKWP